jgi:hypothetical protein
MNTILTHGRYLHTAIHRRWGGRLTRTVRNDDTKQRISDKLKSISDEYGADNLLFGFINSFSEHAYSNLNYQLGNSSLPTFLKDELRSTLQEQRGVPDKITSTFCQTQCDKVCEELLPLDTVQFVENATEINAAPIANEKSLTEHRKTLTENSDWTWHRTLRFIYDRMIFQYMKSHVTQGTDEKTKNWLMIIAAAIAALQVRFLQAAMDNLKTMQENMDLPCKRQESLDAMPEEARNNHLNLRRSQRQRFIAAQSHYQANLHMFRLATDMLTDFFSLFNRPCRFR